MRILSEILDEVFPPKEKTQSAKLGVIIGLMGTGKTTFSKLLYTTFKTKYGSTTFTKLNSVEEFLELMENCEHIGGENVFFLLDDCSFSLFGVTRETRTFLHEFFKIRHYCYNKSKIFSLFIVHYSKSISRFIRSSHLKVLTSIDPVEFKSLSELFPESDLIDYYEYYVKYYKERFIFLIRTPLRSRIVDVTLDGEPSTIATPDDSHHRVINL